MTSLTENLTALLVMLVSADATLTPMLDIYKKMQEQVEIVRQAHELRYRELPTTVAFKIEE